MNPLLHGYMTNKGAVIQNPKAFLVLVCCLFAAFLIGMHLASFLWLKLVPYLVFGIDEVKREAIRVTIDGRHYMEFSNGYTLRGLKFVILQLCRMASALLLVLGLAFLFYHASAWVLKRFGFDLRGGLSGLWKARP